MFYKTTVAINFAGSSSCEIMDGKHLLDLLRHQSWLAMCIKQWCLKRKRTNILRQGKGQTSDISHYIHEEWMKNNLSIGTRNAELTETERKI